MIEINIENNSEDIVLELPETPRLVNIEKLYDANWYKALSLKNKESIIKAVLRMMHKLQQKRVNTIVKKVGKENIIKLIDKLTLGLDNIQDES